MKILPRSEFSFCFLPHFLARIARVCFGFPPPTVNSSRWVSSPHTQSTKSEARRVLWNVKLKGIFRDSNFLAHQEMETAAGATKLDNKQHKKQGATKEEEITINYETFKVNKQILISSSAKLNRNLWWNYFHLEMRLRHSTEHL